LVAGRPSGDEREILLEQLLLLLIVQSQLRCAGSHRTVVTAERDCAADENDGQNTDQRPDPEQSLHCSLTCIHNPSPKDSCVRLCLTTEIGCQARICDQFGSARSATPAKTSREPASRDGTTRSASTRPASSAAKTIDVERTASTGAAGPCRRASRPS